MHVTRSYLVEERSARLIGIQRGSVGNFDPCDMDRVSRRAMTESEASEARITGTEDREWIQGTAQDQFRADFLRRLRADFDAFLAEQARSSDSFNLTRPKGLRTGPRVDPASKPASSTPRPARARKVKPMPAPTTADGQRRANMSLAEYAAMERALGYGSI